MVDVRPPYPYMGGKASTAADVWQRFGDVYNYVEPFAGGAAVFFKRPHAHKISTLNEYIPYITNALRGIKYVPEWVAEYCDDPVNEIDLHSRHAWLVGQEIDVPEEFNKPKLREAYLEGFYRFGQRPYTAEALRANLLKSPHWSDPCAAGWWLWGISQWIGSGWCEKKDTTDKKRPHLLSGNGVLREQLPSLNQNSGKIAGRGPRPNLRPHQGTQSKRRRIDELLDYFQLLSDIMRKTRVVCGDWERVCGPSVTYHIGQTAVFLDPPYSLNIGRMHEWIAHQRNPKNNPAPKPAKFTNRHSGLYTSDKEQDIDKLVARVHSWCLAEVTDKKRKYTGSRYLHPAMKIALCGYDGEHNALEALGWGRFEWKANGGYGNQNKTGDNANRSREVIWFSPHCIRPKIDKQLTLL